MRDSPRSSWGSTTPPTHVVQCAVTTLGPCPDVNRLPVLLLCALAHVTIATLPADAGTTGSGRAIARGTLSVRSVIPAEAGRPTDKPPTGRYRA